MEQQRKEIIEKIAKLTALADDTANENEKSAARQHIAALLARYNLKLSELRGEQGITSVIINLKTRRLSSMLHTFHTVISAFSGCNLIGDRNNEGSRIYHLVGRQVDISATEFMIEVLDRQINGLCVAYKIKYPSAGVKIYNDYFSGLITGVIRELKRIASSVLQYQQKEGLILVDEMKVRSEQALDWFKDANTGRLRFSKAKARTASNGFSDGLSDSKKVRLNAPVTSNQKGSPFAITSSDIL